MTFPFVAIVGNGPGTSFNLKQSAAKKGLGVDALKDKMYEELRFMRVFMKPQGGEADMEVPLVIKSGSDVGMVCDALHRDFGCLELGRLAGLEAKIRSDNRRGVEIDHLVDARHEAVLHQLFDDLDSGDVEEVA